MDQEKSFKKALLGHKNILEYLEGSIRQGKISHAYLFLGPEGIGKKKVAKHFIHAILKSFHSENKDLGEKGQIICQDNLETNPDFHLIEKENEKNQISIEKIRALIHDLGLKPHHSPYKFALIDDVDLLTKGAANSFLKTLEEPSKKTVIVLISSRESFVPETIKSRCQIIRFNHVSPDEIFQYLKEQKLNSSLARKFSKLAQGRPGVAINFHLQPEKYEEYRQNIAIFIDLFEGNIPKKFLILNELKNRLSKTGNSDDEIRKIISVWLSVLRDLLLVKMDLKERIIHQGKEIAYSRLAKNRDPLYFTALINQLIISLNFLKNNVNYHLLLENFVLKI